VSEEKAVTAVVDALAAAWTVANLYPDPEVQPSFRRTGDLIRAVVEQGDVWLDVGPGVFLKDDQEVESTREAAARLAQRCYLHNVASVGLTAPPPDRDLAALMRVLALDEETIAEEGGLSAMLAHYGVTAVAVVTRVPLKNEIEEVAFDRPEEVLGAMAGLTDPTEFAAELVEEAGGDPQQLGELFHDRFISVYEMIDESDVTAIERAVQAFVEAFFTLEEHFQLAVLDPFLRAIDNPTDRIFLDQFAGHELAQIAPRLDSHGFALLMDYARIATDLTDRRPKEVLEWLGVPEGAAGAVQTVAARVQDRLVEGTPGGESFGTLRTQFPDPRRHFYQTLDTFRGLVAVEDRNDRYRRLMRLLTGKIVASVRRQRFRRAELWMRSVTDSPTYPEERAREVEEALKLACTPEVLETLVAHLSVEDSDPTRNIATQLVALNLDVGLDLIATEEDRGRRKVLTGILGQAAKIDPAPVLAALSDPRWFVVRNLVGVLRVAGNERATPHLVHLTDHSDHRVRVEAFRALAVTSEDPIDELGRGLDDDHEMVRRATVGLLAAHPGPQSEALMIGALRGKMTAEEKADVLKHLGDCDSEAAVEALTKLAKRRFVLTSGARLLRNAAREALGAMS
jgi:hypothetical protein